MTPITVTLTSGIIEYVDDAAKRNATSRSQVVRKIILESLHKTSANTQNNH